MIRTVFSHRLIAGLLAVLFSAAPFAFVWCGVNCAHAVAEASEAHACHEEESTLAESTSTVRGVPPPCTHVDADDESASRIETMFTMACSLSLIRDHVDSPPLPVLAWIQDGEARVYSPTQRTASLPLRV